MSNMDVWSSLRWILASNMMLWQHFHFSSEPESPNLGPNWLVWWYKGATISPWDSIPMAQTLCLCLIWMYEAVWGGHLPQAWRYGIISTPQVNLNPQIWGQLCRCNGIRVQPYALLRQHTIGSNILYMSNMDVWSSLRQISASNMMLWHQFHTSSGPELPKVWCKPKCIKK